VIISISIIKGDPYRAARKIAVTLGESDNLLQAHGMVLARKQFHLLAKYFDRMPHAS
jgi:hypothetical protein